MFRPDPLEAGDKVALISPAGYTGKDELEYAMELFTSWGLIPVTGKYTYNRHAFFAGTDRQRIEDLQWAMDDEEIRAVFCTSGGYGSLRIVEELDYSFFQGNPKWLVGSGDFTVFHTKLTSLGVESIHAPLPSRYPYVSTGALTRLKEMLFGKITNYSLPSHPLNRTGMVKGELTGGNLNTLQYLRSTRIEHRSGNSILFIEDTGQELYALDRIMKSFKLSGRLAELEGLVVGQFSDMQGVDFGVNAYEIIREAIDDYNFPVCFGFPAGHTEDNYPLILGASVGFFVEEEGCGLQFQDI